MHVLVCVLFTIVTFTVRQEVRRVEERIDKAERDGVEHVQDADGRGAEEEVDADVHRVQAVLHHAHRRVEEVCNQNSTTVKQQYVVTSRPVSTEQACHCRAAVKTTREYALS